VLGFIVGESLVIAVLGCIGLALALLAIPVLSRAVAGMLPALLISRQVIISGVIAALLVGFVSAILPGIGAMRMRVVDGLRRV
jgi:hypothetical protein